MKKLAIVLLLIVACTVIASAQSTDTTGDFARRMGPQMMYPQSVPVARGPSLGFFVLFGLVLLGLILIEWLWVIRLWRSTFGKKF